MYKYIFCFIIIASQLNSQVNFRYIGYFFYNLNRSNEGKKGDTLKVISQDGITFIKKFEGVKKDTCYGCELGLKMEPPMFSSPTGDSLVDMQLNAIPIDPGRPSCSMPDLFYLETSPFTYTYSFIYKYRDQVFGDSTKISTIKKRYELIDHDQRMYKWEQAVKDSFKYRLFNNINLDIAPKYHIEFIIVFDRDGSFRKLYIRDLWIETSKLESRYHFSFEDRMKQSKLGLNFDTTHLTKYTVFKPYNQILSAEQRTNFRKKRYSCENTMELINIHKLENLYYNQSVENFYSNTKYITKPTLLDFISNVREMFSEQHKIWKTAYDECKEESKLCDMYYKIKLFENGDYREKMTICDPKNIKDFFIQYEWLESELLKKFPELPLQQLVHNLKSMPPIVPQMYKDDLYDDLNSILKNEIHNTGLKIYLTKESNDKYYFNIIELLNDIKDY